MGETYIDISPSKIYIYRKVFFLYQADFVYGIGLEPPHKVIATLLGFHKSHEYGSIIKANQIKFVDINSKPTYLSVSLCHLFTKQEKLRLIRMIK